MLDHVSIFGYTESFCIDAYVDTLPWVLRTPREDQSLWSVEGCAVSDFSHFVRVGLFDMLAIFRAL